jgi:polysaccharide export outer membrane protein
MNKAILALAALLAPLGVWPGVGQQARAQQAADTSATKPAAGAADPAKMGAPKTQESAPSAVDTRTFVLGAEDVIAIKVWREPELSGQFVVRPDGKISLPLVNEIQASGLTPKQLEKALSDGLSKFINQPEVTVQVTTVNSRKYYIQGEVQRPGAYPLVVPTTVLEALVNAGGFREFANTKKITVLRNGRERMRFNYKDVTRGKHPEQNIQLQPGDQIIVP